MAEIVHVRIGVNAATGKLDRGAPMQVCAEGPEPRTGTREPDPAVLEQIKEGETGGWFSAEWDGTTWTIGNRIYDR